MSDVQYKLICEQLHESSMLRESILEELLIKENDPLNAPGTLSCHELLHTSSIVMNGIDSYILNHLACASNVEWFAMAHLAFAAMCRLYQTIGSEHLPKIGESK